MTLNQVANDSYFCTHGFAFVYEGKTDFNVPKVLVYCTDDLEQRTLLYIKRNEAALIRTTIKNSLSLKVLKSLLVQDFNIIQEVSYAENFQK
ncbi:MAG: hypothetical protein FWG68_08685 [Defluviitaleaceae bacterium]|nr:hypothetical protein [Defluviitaleaceae bacterium]